MRWELTVNFHFIRDSFAATKQAVAAFHWFMYHRLVLNSLSVEVESFFLAVSARIWHNWPAKSNVAQGYPCDRNHYGRLRAVRLVGFVETGPPPKKGRKGRKCLKRL